MHNNAQQRTTTPPVSERSKQVLRREIMSTITDSVTFRARAATSIRMLRSQTPYINWSDGHYLTDTHSHPTPRDPLTAPRTQQTKTYWKEEKPRGSRHILDTADFTLWDEETYEYSKPSKKQISWILKTYNAKGAIWTAPFLVVATNTPSLLEHKGAITLTLGGAPIVFITPECFENDQHFVYPEPNALHLIDRTMQDPLSNICQVRKWTRPTTEQVHTIFNTLASYCDVTAINFLGPNMTIEIGQEGFLKGESLPGIVAGWVAVYNFGSYWKDSTRHASMRQIKPEDFGTFPRGDTTDYLRVGDGVVGPGIRVEGRSMSSSSGVRLRKANQVRILLANHAFEQSEQVFHPDVDSGDIVAHVKERDEDNDWALAELVPHVQYSNSKVFECPTPTRLLRGDEIPASEWFVCDGMSTGKIAMRYEGSRWVENKTGEDRVDLGAFRTSSVYFGLCPTGGSPDVRDGICGAPIVNERTGGVAGCFQYMNQQGWCFAPELDTLIDGGWSLY